MRTFVLATKEEFERDPIENCRYIIKGEFDHVPTKQEMAHSENGKIFLEDFTEEELKLFKRFSILDYIPPRLEDCEVYEVIERPSYFDLIEDVWVKPENY